MSPSLTLSLAHTHIITCTQIAYPCLKKELIKLMSTNLRNTFSVVLWLVFFFKTPRCKCRFGRETFKKKTTGPMLKLVISFPEWVDQFHQQINGDPKKLSAHWHEARTRILEMIFHSEYTDTSLSNSNSRQGPGTEQSPTLANPLSE